MKEPIKWFEEAITLGKYQEDVIVEIKFNISENGFDFDKFMNWVSEQMEINES